MARKIKGTLYKRGGVWWVKYQVTVTAEDGSRKKERLYHSLHVTTEKEAKKARDQFMAPLLTSNEAERRAQVSAALRTAQEEAVAAAESARPRLPIAEAWDRHPYNRTRRGGAERDLVPTTVVDNLKMWRRFAEWAKAAGLTNMEDVTQEHAEAFREALIGEGLSGRRVTQCILTVRAVFDLAGMKANPFLGVRGRASASVSRRELTPEELTRVCQAAQGELRYLLAIGIYTGLRLGDAACLPWEAVSADLGTIRLTPSKTKHRGQELVIPVHPELRMILGELPRGTGPIMPGLASAYRLRRDSVSYLVSRLFRQVGICTVQDAPGRVRRASVAGYHALRHSFVSDLARAGVPEHVVRGFVGHQSALVHAVYQHANSEDRRRAIAALPSVSGTRPAPEPEREEWRRLGDTLPIEMIRQTLAGLRERRSL